MSSFTCFALSLAARRTTRYGSSRRTVITSCGTCYGKGPAQRYAMDDRGDAVPIPFVPCAECGLQYPSRNRAIPSPSPSAVPSSFADGCFGLDPVCGQHVGWISSLALYDVAPEPAP